MDKVTATITGGGYPIVVLLEYSHTGAGVLTVDSGAVGIFTSTSSTVGSVAINPLYNNELGLCASIGYNAGGPTSEPNWPGLIRDVYGNGFTDYNPMPSGPTTAGVTWSSAGAVLTNSIGFYLASAKKSNMLLLGVG